MPLTELPGGQETLFRKLNVLHRRHVLRWGLADTRCDNDGVRLKDDAVVYQLVNGEGLSWLVYGAMGLPGTGTHTTRS